MNITFGTLNLPNDPTPWVKIAPNDSKEYCVLWLHGWMSTIQKHQSFLEQLATQTNITFASLNYAGHGDHPLPVEETTREQQFSEVVAAFDALKAEGYEKIIVAGTSFGGYMTALLTAKRRPYAVILRAAAIYKDEEFSAPHAERQGFRDPAYEEFKKSISANSSLAAMHAIRQFDGAVYVIEHERDEVVPRNVLRAYFEAARRGNYLVIPATGHAVAKMPEPQKHYDYIRTAVAGIATLLQQEASLIK